MLTNGYNHVAILTNDSEQLHAFYVEVFDAKVRTDGGPTEGPVRLSFVDVGPFECEVCIGNPDAEPGVLHPPGTPAARDSGT